MSLRKQAASGMLWTFSQQFSTQIISFIISVILARLLSPSDFGTVALFSVVTSIASTLVDGGMASSLVRSKDISQVDLSTVFWFNITTAVFLYFLIFFSAPLVADFYKISQLTSIIRVSCTSLVINSLVAVQGVVFVRNMDFKTGFKTQIPSQIIGGLAGLGFAYYGYGVWSIVYYSLLQNIVATVQLWFYSNWRPSLIFDKTKFKEHFGFGYKLTLSILLSNIFNNIYSVVIGKLFSPAQLGYYNRADTLKQLPVSNLSNALNKVTFPLFAKIKDDDVKLRSVYKKLMKLVVFVITPVLCTMIVVAHPLINLLFTEKWLPSVPYFQILALAGILYPIHAYNLNILKVKGRSDLFLRLEIIKKLLIVVVLVISLQYGIIGLIWGQVGASFFSFFINTYYTGKFLNYGTMAQSLDLLPTLLLSGSIGVLFYLINSYLLSVYIDIIQISVTGLGYFLMYFIIIKLCKFKEIDYLKELLKR
jgi:hypothetical protein